MRTLGALICSVVVLVSTHSFATEDESLQIFHAITDTADHICSKVPTTGSNEQFEISGEAKARLGGLLKRLSDLGISGTGQYSLDEYAGVLQKDLPVAIKNNADCKLTVFISLQKLLTTSNSQPAPGGWNLSRDQADSMRAQLSIVSPKVPVYIQCRTMGYNCDGFAYKLASVFQQAGWPVAGLVTSRNGNVMITGERGIKVLSGSPAARGIVDVMQAQDAGGFPAEVDNANFADHILVHNGDRT